MEYEHDVFYKIEHLSIERKKELLYDAKQLSYDWHIDKLDCNISWARKIQKYARFNTILKKLNDDSHFVFIHRRGYKSDKNKLLGEYCIECGFSTTGGINWYLFIYINEKHLNFFIEKYELKPYGD